MVLSLPVSDMSRISYLRWPTLALAGLALLAGCGGRDASTNGWQGTRELIGEVEVVRNPETPPSHIDAEPLWHAPSEADIARFGDWEAPIRLVAEGDRLYVLDQMAHRVYTLRALDGAVEGGFGRRGRGPGEFEGPFGIAVTESGILVGGGRSLERFHPDGTHLESIPLGGLGFGLFSLPSNEVYVNALLGSAGGWRRLGEDGRLGEIAWPTPAGFALADCTRVDGGNGAVIRTSCAQPLVQIVSTDGHVVREISIDKPAASADPSRLEAHLGNVRSVMAESGLPAEMIARQVLQETNRFSPLPSIRGVRVDPDAGTIALWEQDPDDLGDAPATLHLLSASGEYRAAVGFTETWVDFKLSRGRVYALTRDPTTGVVGLTAYRLELPEGE